MDKVSLTPPPHTIPRLSTVFFCRGDPEGAEEKRHTYANLMTQVGHKNCQLLWLFRAKREQQRNSVDS